MLMKMSPKYIMAIISVIIVINQLKLEHSQISWLGLLTAIKRVDNTP